MKKTRIVSCILMLCLITLTLLSCNNKDTLEVNSKNFESLEAAGISLRCFEGPNIWDTVEVYDGTIFAIKERDGVIYLEEWEEEFSHTGNMNYHYLVGVDMGEFDGWVSVVDYGSNYFEDAEEKRIINENCVGILNAKIRDEIDGEVRWWNDLDKCYIFTSFTKIDPDEDFYVGKIYKLWNTEDGDYEFETFVELDANPCAMMNDEDNLIVATRKSLLFIDPNGNVNELFTADYWVHLMPNSIVKLDNSYYVGTAYGILKYNIDTDDVVWYPYYDIEEEE